MIDRERAQQQGVNPQVVAGVVGYALRGQAEPVPDGDKDIPVRIRFKEEDRETLRQLKGFYVPTGKPGGFVPLSAVADVSFLAASRRIWREDKRTARTITLELEKGREDEARARVKRHPDWRPHDGDAADPPRRPGLLHLLRRRPARHRPRHPPRNGDDAGRARPGLRAREAPRGPGVLPRESAAPTRRSAWERLC